MRIVEITENKVSDLYEYAEKMLKYGGKLMNCIEEMSEESGMGMRGGGYGNRGGQGGGSYGSRYGNRYGERGYSERWEEDDDMGEREGYGNRYDMGERRGVRGTGRYSRYR